MPRPILLLKNISLSFSNKILFENFSCQIYPGSRIAIIGRNGSGKSSLLNIILGKLRPSGGEIIFQDDLRVGFVEQTIHSFEELSGGQRFNKKLSQALAQSPDLLLLDEPTNHLDHDNRKSLMRMLGRYQGSLIIATHDKALLRSCIDTLWHIDNNEIHQFSGAYDNYIREINQKRASLANELALLKREKKDTHLTLMKEQKRAKKSKAYGEKKYSDDKLALRAAQAKGQMTCNKNNKVINKKKNSLLEQLSSLYVPEVIIPTFSLPAEAISNSNILWISNADIGYSEDNILLKNVSLSLTGKERIAVLGKNASGKSTLLKAILDQGGMFKTGNWHLPRREHIGYLDQHYSNLNSNLSALDHIRQLRPDWDEVNVRKHLNTFLFRKNEEVTQLAAKLSGGEKARACLSLIAACTPGLLILDEITNNLDLETKEHVIQVLKEYPGAMMIVSHEPDFLKEVVIDQIYTIKQGELLS